MLIIINNNGIYSGFESELYQDLVSDDPPSVSSPPTALLPSVQYQRLAEMVGEGCRQVLININFINNVGVQGVPGHHPGGD